MKTKRCYKCKQARPVTEFSRDRNRADGLVQRCKPCEAERVRQFGNKRRPMLQARKSLPAFPPGTLFTCHGCGQARPVEEYHINRQALRGRQSRCRACVKAYHRARYVKMRAEMGKPAGLPYPPGRVKASWAGRLAALAARACGV